MKVSRIAGLTALSLLACSNPPPPAAPAPAPTSEAPPAPAAGPAAPAASASSPTGDPGPAEAKKTPAEEPPGTPRERLMRAHFKETAVVRDAVIRGALSEAVAPASALAKMEGIGPIQPSWKPSIDALQAASRRISQSPDIPGASAAIADIGVACGTCHAGAGGPKVKIEAPPTPDKTLASRMQRHVWATERLWEALYVPSDPSWKAGVDALAADPFPKEVLDKGGVHARSAAGRFKTLAATAGAAKKIEDRAKAYASLLETCSACHQATRGAK